MSFTILKWKLKCVVQHLGIENKYLGHKVLAIL